MPWGILLMLTVAVQETTLSNGMKVILKEDHSVPLVNVTVVVKSGSVYESDSTLGMTHFLEHMLFDGTETQTRQQIRDRFDEHGTYFNAFTREDFTAYLITAPSEFLEDAIENQADMLMHSILPKKEFEKEKKVVIQEMHKDRANPESVADEIFKKVAFAGTPYAEPVLGYEETIQQVQRGTVWNYYKRFYRPDNMIAIVIGDFRPQDVIKTFERVYGPRPSQPLPKVRPIPPFEPKGQVLKEQVWQFPSCYLMVAFPALPADHTLAPALEVLTEILNSRSDSPYLQKVLYSDSPLVTEASFSYVRHLGFEYLQLTLKTDSPSKARKALALLPESLEELSSLGEDVVRRVRTSILASHAFESENLTYEGMGLAYWVALGSGYDLYESYYQRMGEVTVDQVLQARDQVFKPLRYRGVLLRPSQGGKR